MATAAQSKPCLQMFPAVPGVTEGRAAAVDTSWGLILAGAQLHPHKGCLSPPLRDPVMVRTWCFPRTGLSLR